MDIDTNQRDNPRNPPVEHSPIIALNTPFSFRLTTSRHTMNSFSSPLEGKSKLPFVWPEHLNLALLNRLPERYHVGRRRSRSKSRRGEEDITSLQTSFNMWDGVRDLQKHHFQLSDVQYVVLVCLTLFSLYVAPPAPGVKLLALMGGAWLLLMPATRQFFLPSSMIWVWLVYFFCSR